MKNNKWYIILLISILSFGCRDFFVLNISDKEVNILAPVNDAVISNGQVQFWWDSLRDATKYRLQIVSPKFDSITNLLADTLITGTRFTINLPAGNYQWRIAGVNSGYISKNVTRSFQIDTGQTLTGKTVSIMSPINGTSLNTKNVNFTWNSLSGVILYRIQIDSTSIQKYEYTTSNTSYTLTLNEGNWSWRIRAENNTTISQYSNNALFTIDVSGPSSPILTSPLNNANINQGETLLWQSDAGIAYDSVFVYSDASLLNRVIATRSINKSYTLSTLISGNYYWQVLSFDNANNRSIGSNVFRFTLP